MQRTSQGKIDQRENSILGRDSHKQVPHARDANPTKGLFRKDVDIFQ